MSAQRIGFWLGLAVFVAMRLLPAPEGLSVAGWQVAAVAALMAAWWMTEALPLAATAMLPFLLLPVMGTMKAADIAAAYYSPVLFLVLGGALLALAIEKAGLHRRIALAIAARGGTSPKSVLFAFMLATAFVSMWVSNTATTLIMLPIATSLIVALGDEDANRPFAAAIVLGIAYAASIGGLGTLVGSPTNAIAAGLIEKSTGLKLDFVTWMSFGLPIVLLAIPICWALLVKMLRVAEGQFDRAVVMAAIGTPGPFSTAERRLIPLLLAVVTAWIAAPFVKDALGVPGVEDGVIAVAGALALFLLPDGRGGTLLEWPDTRRAPWDIILMFGGGLALAEAIGDTGLALWIGERLEGAGGLPVWALAALIVALVVLVTEFASNVAAASGFIPVVAGLCLATGIDPVLLAVPAAMAASWGFMMPAGTAPNALAYATGYPKVSQMVRVGGALDLAGIPLIVAVCFAIAALA
jgi:sodium-dependent dicarboxylate transporter 2/3/5